ncbi:MAG: FAD-dependent oxidoreductase [Caldilinea sp. CFX5]|nr:FAD-dependent oxidoreductase [Caldilinea sp. CFX5]
MTNQTSPPARIAIIGGGVTGLTAAYDLARASSSPVAITIYESSSQLGGLAAGFKGRPEWEWPLEQYYHHLFTSDRAMFDLVREIGMADALKLYRPNTGIHYQGKDYPLDSVTRILTFPAIPFIDRLRMGMVIAYLRFDPRKPWRHFDKLRAEEWTRRWMGDRAWDAAWQFQLEGKFGAHYKEVNMAWLWARIYARTPKLGYFDGGFQAFANTLGDTVRKLGVQIQLSAAVESIRPGAAGGYVVQVKDAPAAHYDRVLSTVGPGLMQRMTPDLPAAYLGQLSKLKSMGAVVLTVALDRRLTEQMYWISLPKREGIPLLAMVEHTNMIDPVHYAGDHLLYLGNYLDPDHPYFSMDAAQLVAEFSPYLSRFNPAFQPNWITGAWVHKAKYAQPIPPVGYLDMIPAIRTPLSGLYFASMSQVYPWDRGTNYAVELGHNVATMMQEDMRIR